MELFPEASAEYEPQESPIMPVLYDFTYKNALQNLNYALDKCELSDRVFDLTTYMLTKNPYHYTSMTLRRRILISRLKQL